ncbi:hypothetical protein ARMSODRAFT_979998 [Armillaria solidipes]|uniref:Uncharacterized protein n=1 Tax=Armillaria solidipes TaxID=1076256 RepID=A0A2H3AXF2_9AGAR|nr:hypothetical protein ARMSODRAFT_979998 [Armillaria solidipes]
MSDILGCGSVPDALFKGQANLWNVLKPTIVWEPTPFKGDSVNITQFFNHYEIGSPVHHIKWSFASSDSKEKHKSDGIYSAANITIFFQKFEELALEADVIDNEGQMTSMIKEAVCKTAKDSIYAQPNRPPNTYEEWRHHILQIDYNYWLNQATGGAASNTGNRMMGGLPQKGSSTLSSDKKTATGTVYGGRGQAMDINALKADGNKNCLLQSWNKGKKKEEVRASMTEPAMDSKIKEVKDAARKGFWYTF